MSLLANPLLLLLLSPALLLLYLFEKNQLTGAKCLPPPQVRSEVVAEEATADARQLLEPVGWP
jgi:hypothetical protein